MRNILLIILSVIVTLICVKNQQIVHLNLFVETKITLWKLLLTFFVIGIIFTSLLKFGRGRPQEENPADFDQLEEEEHDPKSRLSDEDRDFLS
ncbi:hypothetical protein HX021_06890 [Sphingobacterium sp. N143]|uniref:hypothetical protein n=1 Tax=Sphingobacterium sp. N143 TaxID=2746727 RepID=UPI0025782AD8|nr:hypothetical protein [Sphingobacterium sp. N143]MDM1294020.1 hypothetical protein [Sphingobacterium sp. N143]